MTIESKDRAALRAIVAICGESKASMWFAHGSLGEARIETLLGRAQEALAQPDQHAERDAFAARLLARNTRLTAALLEMLSCFADLGGTRGPRAAAVAAARAVLEVAPKGQS